KDVTTLDWNADGTYLATGCYDGLARLWSASGTLRATLALHEGPVFALRWNPAGDLLLTGGVDRRVVVWNTAGEPRQQLVCHALPCLDVAWRTNDTFVTCGADAALFVCQLGSPEPLAALMDAHASEINVVRFDPSGRYLATASDDQKVKIWDFSPDTPWSPLEHTREVYTLCWAPQPVEGRRLLATACFDATVRLYDAQCRAHRDIIYALAFSPDAAFLASAGFDWCLHVLNVRD
ncbi:WD40 repeat-like protein, partial [Caulochytrium protostelioides]